MCEYICTRWLVKRKKSEKAMKVIKKIYKDKNIAAETFQEISISYQKANYDSNVLHSFCSCDVAHR